MKKQRTVTILLGTTLGAVYEEKRMRNGDMTFWRLTTIIGVTIDQLFPFEVVLPTT